MAMVLFSSTNNSRLHKELECLKGMMLQLNTKASDIQNEVQNEELQARKKRKSEVTLWLQEVSDIKQQVQSIEIEVEQVSFFRRDRLSKKLQEMVESVEKLLKQSEFPRGLLLDHFKPKGLQLVTQKMEGSTPSRVQDAVWSCFERGEWRVAIFGIGGVGKTTLAMHINNEILKQKCLFEHVYYVTVSRETSVLKLQSDIAKAVGHCLEYEDEPKRAAELRMTLAKREKSLLILDDVWEDITMEEVGISVEGDGCKLLITTRKRDVCLKMKCWPVHMKPLSTDESWDLFKKQLGNFETLPDEVKVIAALVAEECDGLPLGIVTMARSMRGETDVPVWRDALRELQNPCSSSHDMENKVFEILKYSYDRLKKEKHRKCFLYCALYPEDCIIEREELIRKFIAVGLLDGTNRKESIDEGHVVLNVLENASLLECATDKWNINKRCVKMHDLVRDMAIRIMGFTAMVIENKSLKEIIGKEEWIKKDLKWVTLLHNRMDHIKDMMPDFPNISVLFLRDYCVKTISDSFFVKMINLKVVDLSYIGVEVLPVSVSDLYNLTSLMLCGCTRLRFIPSLAKLTKLRELNLNWCESMRELPEGMEELASLEHLDLSFTKVEVLPAFVSDLCNLTSLILRSGHILCFIPSLAKLKKLIELDLKECHSMRELPDGMEELASLEHLDLSNTRVEVMPAAVSNLCNLTTLMLSGCLRLSFIPSLAKLTKLRELDLKGCHSMRELPEVMEELTSLEHLDLSNTRVRFLPAAVSDMCNLTSLMLRSCHILCFIPSLAKLTKLRELDLNWCVCMRKLPEGMEELASLERLDLSNTGVEVLPAFVSDLCNLTSLMLSGCLRLHFIPSLAKLKKLRKLDLKGCPFMRELPEGMEELASLEHLNLQGTKIKKPTQTGNYKTPEP